MITGALVLPRVTAGKADASTTRRPVTPRTRNSGSHTSLLSGPIAAVLVGWYIVSLRART